MATPRRTARLVVGVLLVIVGAVWTGQGFGAIKGSFMTDQGEWIVIGLITVAVGLALLVGARRRHFDV